MLTCEQQKDLATTISHFLSENRRFTDSFIIDFFTEDLWGKLPESWRSVLDDLTYPQVADLLLDRSLTQRRYPSVWPLSLLAHRSAAHALAFPRGSGSKTCGRHAPEEFLQNQSQSSLLEHIFRKHVKPKKQHEICRLGALVKRLSEETEVSRVVDVGSGQGHLTRLLSFGLRLSVTAIEADPALVATATRFDEELRRTLEKREKTWDTAAPPSLPRHVAGLVKPGASWGDLIQQLDFQDTHEHGNKRLRGSDGYPPVSPDFLLTGLHACGDLSTTLLRHFVHCPHVRGITSVACCYMKVTTADDPAPPGSVGAPQTSQQDCPPQFGYPMSSLVRSLPGHQLSYRSREAACHALEDYLCKLRQQSAVLRAHAYRATLEAFIREVRPDLSRAGIQTGRKSHLLPFADYARLGLARVGLSPDLPVDSQRVESMLRHQNRVVVFYSLCLLLSPVVETLVLLDRMLFLQEHGFQSQLVPLFDPGFSPRNLVLVALKTPAS
ncbi:protein RRNAD1 isoform X1 [Synchiropus splendidus]|uniref:protein RRNAD1 isoform X1 n=1 Tax=Synchiropus splendidus TaxID=270530 RepID=UPI00237DD9E0|nr:protein RRNAD1 isoform X1 [Synchiropus splendidus]